MASFFAVRDYIKLKEPNPIKDLSLVFGIFEREVGGVSITPQGKWGE